MSKVLASGRSSQGSCGDDDGDGGAWSHLASCCSRGTKKSRSNQPDFQEEAASRV